MAVGMGLGYTPSASRDEIHAVLVDEDGEITGGKDRRGDALVRNKQPLENYVRLSVANGAVGSTGDPLYYKEVINDQSDWIRWTDHDTMGDAPTDGGAAKLTYDWGATIDQGNTSAKFAVLLVQQVQMVS